MKGWTVRIAGLRRWAMSAAGVVVVVVFGIVLILWIHPPSKDAPSTSVSVAASAKGTEEPPDRVLRWSGIIPRPGLKRETQQQPSTLSEVDAIRAALERASIAFNVPTPIKHDTTVEVQLLLSVSKSAPQLIQEVEGYGLRESAEVRVSRRVRAELMGSGFDIKPTTPLDQAIPSSEDVEWKWDIKAVTRDPRAVLHLSISSLALVDGATTPAWHRTFDRWIEIEITAQQRLEHFVGQNWQWLWAAILVPIAGWGWRLLRASRARATADANADGTRSISGSASLSSTPTAAPGSHPSTAPSTAP
jgi:hypothetical protein